MGFAPLLTPPLTVSSAADFSPAITAVSSKPLSDLTSQKICFLLPTPCHLPCPRLVATRRSVLCRYSSMSTPVAAETPAEALRKILASPGIHQGPACFDALSAKLIERAGFQYCFMSGFSVSAARLALPDVGLISYGEILDQGRQITEAVAIPVIGDGDNGYGNHMSVKRTIKGFINAGFAGIILEDQDSPKACGHTQGRKVVPRDEAIMRIKAAIDAREESGSDIVIVARTDARQAISLQEALLRSRAFADIGADILFIDALASREEMHEFCKISPLLPKMANMLEGGGKTPIFSPIELEHIGFKLVSYPLSLVGVSIRAMEDALTAIKGGRVPPPSSLPSFEEIKETLGFNKYYKEELRYALSASQFSRYHRGYSSIPTYDGGKGANQDNESGTTRTQYPIIDVLPPAAKENSNPGNSWSSMSGIWSRTLRIKITGRDGLQKLDVRIPAGFLEGVERIIPGLAGANILERLEDAAPDASGEPQIGKVLLDFNDAAGDRIQVFVE